MAKRISFFVCLLASLFHFSNGSTLYRAHSYLRLRVETLEKIYSFNLPQICCSFHAHSLFTYVFFIHWSASFCVSCQIFSAYLRFIPHERMYFKSSFSFGLPCRKHTYAHFLTQNLIKIYVVNMPCYVNECAVQQNYWHKNAEFITKTAIQFKLVDVKSMNLR